MPIPTIRQQKTVPAWKEKATASLRTKPEKETGDTVLDPFCGSGTTGAVAIQEGRDFIGIDINPEYSKMSEQRIRAAAQEGATP